MQLKFSDKVNGRILRLLASVVHRTCRFDVIGFCHVRKLQAEGKPLLWAGWHGQNIALTGFALQYLKDREIQVMIPDDWRGAALYYLFKLSPGIEPHPMDLETKGIATARRFARLVKLIKTSNKDNFIAPDGPAGPAYEVKPGVVYLAQKVGAPLLPAGVYTRYKYELPRWDTHLIPLPFTRFQMVIGKPLFIPRDVDYRDYINVLRDRINEVNFLAKAAFYAGKGPR